MLIFLIVRQGKKSENGPKYPKKLSIGLYISGTILEMIVIMVHMWKIVISPSAFFFLILILQIVSKVEGQKMIQNDKKIVSCTPYLSNHT